MPKKKSKLGEVMYSLIVPLSLGAGLLFLIFAGLIFGESLFILAIGGGVDYPDYLIMPLFLGVMLTSVIVLFITHQRTKNKNIKTVTTILASIMIASIIFSGWYTDIAWIFIMGRDPFGELLGTTDNIYTVRYQLDPYLIRIGIYSIPFWIFQSILFIILFFSTAAVIILFTGGDSRGHLITGFLFGSVIMIAFQFVGSIANDGFVGLIIYALVLAVYFLGRMVQGRPKVEIKAEKSQKENTKRNVSIIIAILGFIGFIVSGWQAYIIGILVPTLLLGVILAQPKEKYNIIAPVTILAAVFLFTGSFTSSLYSTTGTPLAPPSGAGFSIGLLTDLSAFNLSGITTSLGGLFGIFPAFLSGNMVQVASILRVFIILIPTIALTASVIMYAVNAAKADAEESNSSLVAIVSSIISLFLAIFTDIWISLVYETVDYTQTYSILGYTSVESTNAPIAPAANVPLSLITSLPFIFMIMGIVGTIIFGTVKFPERKEKRVEREFRLDADVDPGSVIMFIVFLALGLVIIFWSLSVYFTIVNPQLLFFIAVFAVGWVFFAMLGYTGNILEFKININFIISTVICFLLFLIVSNSINVISGFSSIEDSPEDYSLLRTFFISVVLIPIMETIVYFLIIPIIGALFYRIWRISSIREENQRLKDLRSIGEAVIDKLEAEEDRLFDDNKISLKEGQVFDRIRHNIRLQERAIEKAERESRVRLYMVEENDLNAVMGFASVISVILFAASHLYASGLSWSTFLRYGAGYYAVGGIVMSVILVIYKNLPGIIMGHTLWNLTWFVLLLV